MPKTTMTAIHAIGKASASRDLPDMRHRLLDAAASVIVLHRVIHLLT